MGEKNIFSLQCQHYPDLRPMLDFILSFRTGTTDKLRVLNEEQQAGFPRARKRQLLSPAASKEALLSRAFGTHLEPVTTVKHQEVLVRKLECPAMSETQGVPGKSKLCEVYGAF